MRLGRLTNPKVEVLVWASLLRCWTRSLALQESEQELAVSVRSLRSLSSLGCEKVLNTDVRCSCAAGRWSARWWAAGGRIVRTVLRRRVRVATAVGMLSGFGRHDVAGREGHCRWFLRGLLRGGQTKETRSIIGHAAVDGRHVTTRRLETRLRRVDGTLGS